MQFNLIRSTSFLESDYIIQITCNQLPSSDHTSNRNPFQTKLLSVGQCCISVQLCGEYFSLMQSSRLHRFLIPECSVKEFMILHEIVIGIHAIWNFMQG